ncbi:chromate transporter [Alkalithermobacter thermoalcaliphilus JW-YL-7 = DSM 7308]|uniref:Chromate transporter n=1 Tax=Alkalithermobacter thermoalcaliphilus JW-YL-7 = DSM 7308 TaxID=1121328 RepID=A0A150FTK4_CLOPD|nr:Chromate transporter [[Clostridium] paradoxum JW-YL-7 = DSM 7308]SHK36341.1 chromate transporter [[Clostridium] paradoxum JW-YL-7 = DSM 7308]
MDTFKSLIDIFFSFFKIGAFSFGGGYSMLPFIERELVLSKGLITFEEFLDILAISQASPGPIAINSATFIGYKHLGILGSFFATFGVIFFSLICISSISPKIEKYKENKYILMAFKSLRPITISLILSSIISLFSKSIVDYYSLIIFLLSSILLFYKKVHPISVILLCGSISAILHKIF